MKVKTVHQIVLAMIREAVRELGKGATSDDVASTIRSYFGRDFKYAGFTYQDVLETFESDPTWEYNEFTFDWPKGKGSLPELLALSVSEFISKAAEYLYEEMLDTPPPQYTPRRKVDRRQVDDYPM